MGATEAQHWWGEAPELGLIFAALLVGFYYRVYNANRLPSRGPGAMQLETAGCTTFVLGRWQVWSTAPTSQRNHEKLSKF